jgi:hypothetical protein
VTEVTLALTRSAAAWDSPSFKATLGEELQVLGSPHPALRPLPQAGQTQTAAVAELPLGVQLLRSDETAGQIHLDLGVVYAGVIAGCSCADDPTPVDTITEHCELLLEIDPPTARAWVTACGDKGHRSTSPGPADFTRPQTHQACLSRSRGQCVIAARPASEGPQENGILRGALWFPRQSPRFVSVLPRSWLL